MICEKCIKKKICKSRYDIMIDLRYAIHRHKLQFAITEDCSLEQIVENATAEVLKSCNEFEEVDNGHI
jgi:hypothetical protein